MAAQAGTDVWIVPLAGTGQGISAGVPVPVAIRAGYDNQPSFSLDGGRLFYTAAAGGQTDIWSIRLDGQGVPRGSPQPVTQTPESEYSATEVPERSRISVIRVEADSTQRLWSFDLNGQDPRLELEDVAPVGYHAWSTPEVVGLFVLGSPPRFVIADAPDGDRRTVAEGIGRSLHRVPGHVDVGLGRPLLSFTARLGDGTHVVSTFSPDGVDTSGVTALPEGVQDYAWLPDRSIVAGSGSTLMRWTQADGWQPIGDLGLGAISRIAVHPDGGVLAVVVEEP